MVHRNNPNHQAYEIFQACNLLNSVRLLGILRSIQNKMWTQARARWVLTHKLCSQINFDEHVVLIAGKQYCMAMLEIIESSRSCLTSLHDAGTNIILIHFIFHRITCFKMKEALRQWGNWHHPLFKERGGAGPCLENDAADPSRWWNINAACVAWACVAVGNRDKQVECN